MLSRRGFLTLTTLASSGFAAGLTSCSPQKKQTDIIVIGAGHAGLAAAAGATQNGDSVVVLERRPLIGLNTHSDRGLFASSLSPEGSSSFGDSPENHFRQSYEAGGRLADADLLRAYTENAPSALKWLKTLGMRFDKDPINSNSLWRRCYQPLHTGYTETLYREALIRGAEFRFDRTAQSMERKDSFWSVSTRDSEDNLEIWVARKAVILCAGGFGANKRLIGKYATRYRQLSSDNQPGSNGEVLQLASSSGAALTGMDRIACLPRPPGNLHSQGYLHLDVSRFLFINKAGKRFVSEDALRPQITEAFFQQGDLEIYEVADDATVSGYQIDIQRDLWRGIENGTVFRGKTLDALAEKISVLPTSLRETVDRYNRFVELGTDSDFRKIRENLTHKLETAPFWAVRVEMMIHETLGGLVVDPLCRVLKENNEPIKGLFAAGSIIGNLHGNNRLGGNGISSAVTLGRLAGQQAARTGRA